MRIEEEPKPDHWRQIWLGLGVLATTAIGTVAIFIYGIIGLVVLAGFFVFSDGIHTNWSGEYTLQRSEKGAITKISALPGLSAGAVRNREGYNAEVILRAPVEKWTQLAAENNCGGMSQPLYDAHAAVTQRIELTLKPGDPISLSQWFSFSSENHALESSFQDFGRDDYTHRGNHMVRLGLAADNEVTSYAVCPYRESQRSLCRIHFQPHPNFRADVLSYAYLNEDWDGFIGMMSCLANKMATVEQEATSAFGGIHFNSSTPISNRGAGERQSYTGRSRDTYCLDHVHGSKFGDLDGSLDTVWPRRCDLSVTLYVDSQATPEYPYYADAFYLAHSIAWRYGLRTAAYDENRVYRELYSTNFYFGEIDGFPIKITCQAQDAGITPWCQFGYPEVSEHVQLSYRFPRNWLHNWRDIHRFVLANLDPKFVPRITPRSVPTPGTNDGKTK